MKIFVYFVGFFLFSGVPLWAEGIRSAYPQPNIIPKVEFQTFLERKQTLEEMCLQDLKTLHLRFQQAQQLLTSNILLRYYMDCMGGTHNLTTIYPK